MPTLSHSPLCEPRFGLNFHNLQVVCNLADPMRWPFELNPGYGLLQTDTSAVTTQRHREALLSPSL